MSDLDQWLHAIQGVHVDGRRWRPTRRALVKCTPSCALQIVATLCVSDLCRLQDREDWPVCLARDRGEIFFHCKIQFNYLGVLF